MAEATAGEASAEAMATVVVGMGEAAAKALGRVETAMVTDLGAAAMAVVATVEACVSIKDAKNH